MTSIMCNGAKTVNMEMQKDDGVELPPGFRFHPTDEELLSYYLTKKISNPQFHAIKALIEVDLNKCEPWDLPEKAKVGENEWYFFNLRDRKYPTGMRTNRATEKGYWKATGKDREVVNSRRVVVGMKKTLVFYGGRAPKGLKTSWIMHEYRLESTSHFNAAQQPPRSKQDEWVVCRVFQKMVGNKKPFMYADHVAYQLPNQGDDSPNQGDNSPNPTLTDSDDCYTCTATKSGHNCQDSFGEGHTSHVAVLDATSVLRQWRAVPKAIPYNHYDYQSKSMMATIAMKSFRPPQSMVSHPLNPHDHCYIPAKEEQSFYTTSWEGEAEARSSQRLNNLDYVPWPGDVLYDNNFPIESSLNQGESGQTYNCAPRSFSTLPEMAGPIDGLQECMWAY